MQLSLTNSIGEDAFAMDLSTFWEFCRANKILSPLVSVAAINRIYMSGEKNKFDLKHEEKDLIDTLELIKSLKRHVSN